MKYKRGQVIKVNGSVPLMNPEDWFNDMIKDEIMSVEQALDNIISECIVMSKVEDMLVEADQDELYGVNHKYGDDGMVTVQLEEEGYDK